MVTEFFSSLYEDFSSHSFAEWISDNIAELFFSTIFPYSSLYNVCTSYVMVQVTVVPRYLRPSKNIGEK